MEAYRADSDTPVIRGKNVAVTGAGNVAMDAARTAVRMGAERVSVIYRRGRDEMPARADEITHAEEEGVEFILLTAPLEFLGDKTVSGVKCIKCELGVPDASGRRSPVEVPGSEFTVPCDMAIIAIGASPNPLIKRSCPGLKTAGRGTLIIDQNAMTSIKGVYAGGDAVTGAATVISAMGAGKKAAAEIVKKLRTTDDG